MPVETSSLIAADEYRHAAYRISRRARAFTVDRWNAKAAVSNHESRLFLSHVLMSHMSTVSIAFGAIAAFAERKRSCMIFDQSTFR